MLRPRMMIASAASLAVVLAAVALPGCGGAGGGGGDFSQEFEKPEVTGSTEPAPDVEPADPRARRDHE